MELLLFDHYGNQVDDNLFYTLSPLSSLPFSPSLFFSIKHTRFREHQWKWSSANQTPYLSNRSTSLFFSFTDRLFYTSGCLVWSPLHTNISFSYRKLCHFRLTSQFHTSHDWIDFQCDSIAILPFATSHMTNFGHKWIMNRWFQCDAFKLITC